MDKYNYNHLTPFKWFVIQNFPFIEADFDAMTNWQLFEKLGYEINKIINSQNNLGEQMENITNAFIDLEAYIDNYFENLDVQEEINNKLDEMTQTGELSNIISGYINPLIEQQNVRITNFENEVNEELDTQNTVLNTRLNQIDNKVNSVASGSPLVANSISDMVDTTKTYVLTTDGEWYYYDGTEWVSGGTYQTTGIGDENVTYSNLFEDLQNTFDGTPDIETSYASGFVDGKFAR